MVSILEEKLFYKKEFIQGLFALLRQIELSVDRSRWTGVEELKLFLFSDDRIKLAFQKLLGKLKNKKLVLHEIPTDFQRWLYFKNRFGNSYYLTGREVQTICYLLNKIMNYDSSSYERDVFECRELIARFAYCVIEPRLTRKEVKEAQFVEHFLEAQNFDTKTIEEISGGWLG